MDFKKINISIFISCLSLLLLLTNKTYAISTDTTVKRGNKTYYYDNNNRLLQKVSKERFFKKGYCWKYDTIGNITAKGPIKLRQRHGRWKFCETKGKYTVKKYKYGLDKSEIYSTYGHKMDIILTFGYAPRTGQDERHRVIYRPVAACVVSRKHVFVQSLNNSLVLMKKRIRYGKNWETGRHEMSKQSELKGT